MIWLLVLFLIIVLASYVGFMIYCASHSSSLASS